MRVRLHEPEIDKSKQPIFYVYICFRPDNGRPCYVGKGSGYRHTWINGIDVDWFKNIHFARLVKKLDREFPVVIIRDGLTESEAFELEATFIKSIERHRYGGPLVNMTDGGEGSVGLIQTDEWSARMREVHIGRKNTPETLEKMREAALNRLARTGGTFIEETLEKMRQAKLGKKQPREQTEKIRQANTGKKRSSDFGDRSRAQRLAEYADPEKSAYYKSMRSGRWINDGTKNRRIPFSEDLPNGWVIGRLPSPNVGRNQFSDRVRL